MTCTHPPPFEGVLSGLIYNSFRGGLWLFGRMTGGRRIDATTLWSTHPTTLAEGGHSNNTQFPPNDCSLSFSDGFLRRLWSEMILCEIRVTILSWISGKFLSSNNRRRCRWEINSIPC